MGDGRQTLVCRLPRMDWLRNKFLGKDDDGKDADGKEGGEGVEGGEGGEGGSIATTTTPGGEEATTTTTTPTTTTSTSTTATGSGEAKTAAGGGRMPWEEEDGERVVWEESGGGGRGNPFVRSTIVFPAIPRRSQAWVKMETFSSSRTRVKRRRHARDMKTRKHGTLIRRHTSKRRPKSNPSSGV